MDEIIHESNLINVSAATAKEKKKKSGHYVLYLAMAAAAFICPVCFAIYFAIKANAVGIWAYAVTALVAAGVMTAIFVVFIPKYKENVLYRRFLRGCGKSFIHRDDGAPCLFYPHSRYEMPGQNLRQFN